MKALCLTFFLMIATGNVFGQIPVTDVLSVSATEALTAIQASNWYQQLAQMAEQVATMTETLETVQDQLEVAEEALDTARELNDYVGDPKKILGKFQGKFVSPKLAEFASTVQDTIKSGEDLYDQYDEVKGEWEATIDQYKKFTSVEDIYKTTVDSKKEINENRKEILEELKRLGEEAAEADTDIDVQKTATAIEATKASLEVLNAEERAIQDHLVNQHLRNENDQLKQELRDKEILDQCISDMKNKKYPVIKRKEQ